jgi:AraC-like DNA-binding protein
VDDEFIPGKKIAEFLNHWVSLRNTANTGSSGAASDGSCLLSWSLAMSASSSTGGDSDCVVVRFSTADYAPQERVDAWREIYGRTLQKMDIEPLSAEELHAEAMLLRMPGLAMMAGRRFAAIYDRKRQFTDHDGVSVTWALSSSCHANQVGRTVDVTRGQAIVLTCAEPGFLRVPRLDYYFNLLVPRRCLSPLIANLDDAYGRSIPAENSALQLLMRYIGILQEEGTFAVPELRRQAVLHIHDLLALAIGATRDAAEIARSRGARAARLRAIKEDIANRLDQPDLSVATIALRHRIKPRWVQRLFESEGMTFTEYILAQRLLRAHRLLSDPRFASQKIGTIALDVGFGDVSYFNRAFRRRYGMAPSELRTAASPRD